MNDGNSEFQSFINNPNDCFNQGSQHTLIIVDYESESVVHYLESLIQLLLTIF